MCKPKSRRKGPSAEYTVSAIPASWPRSRCVVGLSASSSILNFPQCDRAIPCGSCRSEKRKPRTCEYSEKAQGIARARQEAVAQQAYRHASGSTDPDVSDPRDHQVPNAVSHPSEPRQRASYTLNSPGLIHKGLSLYKVVDEVRCSCAGRCCNDH